MSKHNQGIARRVISQVKKCKCVKRIERTAKGYMICLKSGEQNLIHDGSNCYHPLRRWLKAHTTLKNLKF